ncbi:AvrD family protein [Pseudomonas savastanoi]|uniref:AvrD protein n=1 Tax=Pseudomonas savastanoi pv. glycinea TaxID=318 RepID=O08242_PSESG|nr:AvrD family protein [Pseudomonas savastanoi]AAB53624.1 avrD [Pseudomonas savastanoi pv. glycinea]RML87034.1 AvrD protein [Pseudomonas savastanoi pv. glycinea]
MQDLSFSTIENHLGPAKDRFFGDGFKHVEYSARHVNLTESAANASISLSYPANWSKKNDSGELIPHLSSIDALTISINLSQDILLNRFKSIDHCWVRRISIRAGKKPEEDLRNINAKITKESQGLDSQGDTNLIFGGNVGTMTVQLEFIIPAAHEVDTIKDSTEKNCYSLHFKNRTQFIDDIIFYSPLNAISKLFVANDNEPHFLPGGIEANYPNIINPVDSLVSYAQIAQALLYKLDGLTRGESNTLWMRNLNIIAENPAKRRAATRLLVTELKRANIVSLNGENWRVAEVAGHMNGITFSSSVAHLLPL